MIYPKEELFGEINKKAIVFIINTCYNVKRSFLKGGFNMKVRSSVKPICEKCKIRNTNRDKDNPLRQQKGSCPFIMKAAAVSEDTDYSNKLYQGALGDYLLILVRSLSS